MRKKLLALVLALAMVLSLMVVPVSADDADIPDGALEFDGHNYYVYDSLATASDGTSAFEQAEAYCESLGGHLATITSQEENDAVYEYLTSLGYKNVFLGLTDAESEGTWKWANGESLSYTNWSSGEPNGSTNENYGMFYSKYTSGKWNDGDWDGDSTSGTLAAFLCEWDCAGSSTVSDISVAKYDEDKGEYTSDFEELYMGDSLIFSVEVTVPANTDVTFDISNWVCTDADGNASSAVEFGRGFVNGPNTAEDENYEIYYISVTAELEVDGIYTVTFNSPLGESASVKFEVLGYYWIFGEDNFCFTNSYSAFGFGSIYIEDEMFNAYLDTLDNTQITRMADEYGSYSKLWDGVEGLFTSGATNEEYYRIANFLNNDLKSWGGACYGMSLVSALIKTGNLSAEDLVAGSGTTYELPALNSGDNTTLESIINLYHISQKTASVFNTDNYKYGFGGVIEMMWDIASSIGDGEQPFLVYLNSSDGDDGHCVVCYGAETGEYSTGSLWWKEGYTKRLLIYDPNSDEEEYLYISDDFNSVDITCDDGLFSGCEFEVFGFYANETTFVEALDIDHNVYLDVDNMLVYQYTIYSSDGSYAEVSDGTVVGGTLDANIVWTASVLADDEEVEAENEIYTVYLPDDAEYYRIVPAEGETLDALMTFDDFSINVSGTMESATIYANGTVEVVGAEGDLAIDVTLNNSEFDFVGITGSADGDVTVYVSDESIIVTGNLTDYVVENMNRDCETDGVSVEDDTDIKVTMENETVVAYADLDGDGEYETEISDSGATNPFTDVNTDHYFYNAVLWVVDNGITSGTTETTFSPFLTAERCQVVTFLWRAAGCPEPTSTENPFTDVNEGDYFYTAVLWAVENGITTGTSDTTFSPYATCERCQVVTFLYRYFGEPEVTVASNPFTDVDTDDYFYNAVLWAVDNGITTGTSETTFGPFVTCERCMVVTFLYRALVE